MSERLPEYAYGGARAMVLLHDEHLRLDVARDLDKFFERKPPSGKACERSADRDVECRRTAQPRPGR